MKERGFTGLNFFLFFIGPHCDKVMMQTPLNTIVVQLYNTGAALKSSQFSSQFSVLVAVNLKGMGAVLVCVRGTLRSYSAWAGESPTSKSTTRGLYPTVYLSRIEL